MKYNQPFGVVDEDAGYINGNPSTGQMGSIPPAASIEYPQREIVNLIASAGLIPNNDSLHQLTEAIQTGELIYGVDSGLANAYAFNLTPPILSYYDGLFVWMMPTNANTGPSTVNINSLGIRNIVRRGGNPLSAGDLPANYKSLLCYNSIHNNFELYGSGWNLGTGFLPILTANTILYVNGTTGDDTLYDGTTAAISGPHGPFKTIGRAITETFKYGPSIYTMTINVANGTYPENVATPPIVGPRVILNGADKTNTIISGLPGGGYTLHVTNANTFTVQNCNIRTSSATLGTSCVVSSSFGILTVNNCLIGSAVGGYMLDALGGTVVVGNIDFAAASAALAVLVAFSGGTMYFGNNSVVNHLGTLTCNVYATASAMALITTPPPGAGAPIFNNAGFVTGQKFATALNGVIHTQGQSVSWFPGTIAGSNTSGGQYG